MRISASTRASLNLHLRNAGAGARDDAEPAGRSTLPAVVVPPEKLQEAEHNASTRIHAQFLAQLVAGIEDMPATRVRRRADPETATSCYRAIAGLAGELPHVRIRSI